MEFTNFDHEEIIESHNLEEETLVGWSIACLDQTISYYKECNKTELNTANADINYE